MILFASAAALPPLCAEPAAGQPLMRDVVTTVSQAEASPGGILNPIQALKPIEKAPVLKSPEPVSILTRCAFLSSQGVTALIPKGSVIHVPPRLKGQVRMVEGNRVVIWPEFFRRNRGWVTTVEVTRSQASGVEPIPERTLEAIRKNPRVVIATLQGGPISVLPPKEPEPGQEQPVQPDTEVAISSSTKS